MFSAYSTKSISGEIYAVKLQAESLRNSGHEVRLFSENTDLLSTSPFYQIESALSVATGFGRSPLKDIVRFNPDVVHIHNLFPNYGYRWVRNLNSPVVLTLHNYRLICARSTLSRDGRMCNLCPREGSINSLKHRCYKESIIKTIPLGIMTRNAGNHHELFQLSDSIVVLSERFKRNIEAEIGEENHEKISCIPNFINIPSQLKTAFNDTDSWIFAGRISKEKGILDMLDGWSDDLPLKVFGGGPDLENAKMLSREKPNIQFPGIVSVEEIYRILNVTKKFVFSSTWSEGCPMSYLQALASSSAVVASKGNAVADDLELFRNGLQAENPREIYSVAKEYDNKNNYYGEKSRTLFESNYSEAVWLERINKVYASIQN